MYLAATLTVGLLCLLDLVLTAGVVRRLREHAGHLERLLAGRGAAPAAEQPVLAPGTAVSEFTGVTVDGEPISLERFGDQALVGFFSPGCPPCELLVPEFAQRAAQLGGRKHALAVLSLTSGQDVSEYLRQLELVAKIVVEDHGGAIGAAFRVAAFPSVYLLDVTGTTGSVVASGTDLTSIAATAPLARAR